MAGELVVKDDFWCFYTAEGKMCGLKIKWRKKLRKEKRNGAFKRQERNAQMEEKSQEVIAKRMWLS